MQSELWNKITSQQTYNIRTPDTHETEKQCARFAATLSSLQTIVPDTKRNINFFQAFSIPLPVFGSERESQKRPEMNLARSPRAARDD